MKGIDISMHNGSIDFNEVKNDGVEVIIIKATEGVNYTDPKFEEYYNACKNLGFHIGFYHFMSEKTSPVEQAIDFYNAIKDKSFDVFPVLDVETNNMGRSSKIISDRCLAFLEQFANLSSMDCVIYTGAYFGRDNLDDRVKVYKGWIAHYGVAEPMETGFKVVGHQYSETERINGISGDCDLNHFTDGILLCSGNGTVTPQPKYEFYSNKTRYLQRILGVEDDNIWGPVTDAAAKKVIAGKKYKTPELTRWIQKVLRIKEDGIFWTDTEAAVIAYQHEHHLVEDGIVGYNTLKSMALS